MSTDYDNGHVGESSFWPPRSYSRPDDTLNYSVRGSIAAVYGTDNENQAQGQILCDVVCFDLEKTLFRVPVYTPAFHAYTDPADKESRQNSARQKRNILDGESWVPSVGTLCVVQWVGPPPNMQPFISHFIPTNFQSLPHADRKEGDSLFPREAQAVTTFDANGEPKEEFRARLQPTESEMPRWTRMQNGTAIEIDNRGNANIQTTINKEKIERERYSNYTYQKPELVQTPDPEGNIVFSTRGAKKGNIGLVTGKITTTKGVKNLFDANGNVIKKILVREAIDEANEEGNILIKTVGADAGNVDHVVMEIDPTTGQPTGSGKVSLGLKQATHAVVLGDNLLNWIIDQLLTHHHFDVRPGNSKTGISDLTAPDILSDLAFTGTSKDLTP